MPRNLAHHSASKAGLTMVMKKLARVLAPDGIRVNAIAPGATPGGGFVVSSLDELVAQIPLGRAGTPDDMHRSPSPSCQKDSVNMRSGPPLKSTVAWA